MEAANEQKRSNYTDLVESWKEAGWKAIMLPVEVACRDFLGSSVIRLLCDLGCKVNQKTHWYESGRIPTALQNQGHKAD